MKCAVCVVTGWTIGFAVLCLGFVAQAQSQEQAQQHSITIVTEDFPPYNYWHDNRAKGLSTEVVKAVLEETGIESEIEFYPWARSYLMTQNGRNTLIYSIARIEEREDLFHWVGTIAPYRTSLYKLKTNDAVTVRELDQAKNYYVGVSVEDVIFTYLKSKGFSKLEVAGRDVFNLRKLMLGRLDLVAYDEASFQHMLVNEEMDPSRFERVFRLEDLSGELYMAFGRDTDPALVTAFREGLQAVKDKGIYDEILTNYGLVN